MCLRLEMTESNIPTDTLKYGRNIKYQEELFRQLRAEAIETKITPTYTKYTQENLLGKKITGTVDTRTTPPYTHLPQLQRSQYTVDNRTTPPYMHLPQLQPSQYTVDTRTTPPYTHLTQLQPPQYSPLFQPIQGSIPFQVSPFYTEPTSNTQLNWTSNLAQNVMTNQGFYMENEIEGNLIIDKQCDSNVNSILGNASTDLIRKVTEWQERSMMQESIRKEITHMKLERHEGKFVNEKHK